MATTRFGDRNLARPGIRRNPLECNNVTKPLKDGALKPSTKPLSSNVFGVSRAYDTRFKKNELVKPSTKRAMLPEKPKTVKQSSIDELSSKLSNFSIIQDVDEDDKENPLMCSEYIVDIYQYMRQMETFFEVDGDYLSKQTDITEKMRSILVDWIIQVHQKFKLLHETLYLSILILDRYLSKTDIKRDKLQLVGVTSILIASKFEEIYAPEVNDFVYITNNAYTFQEILAMEIEVLNKLAFDINHPLPLHFLRRCSKVASADGKIHTLGKYLLDLCLAHPVSYKFRPSEMAAGAFLVAQHALAPTKRWGRNLAHYTGYTREQAMVPAQAIAQLVVASETSRYQAARTKYSSSKYMEISNIPELKNVKSLLSTL